MKKIILSLLLSLTIAYAYSQGSVDALRYSFVHFGGNARYMSMGGAFGALGANSSVFSTNPAGIGFFSRSDFNISTSILYSNAESTYNGDLASDSRLNAGIQNVGVVLTNDYLNIQTRGKWKNIQFGLGVNQLKNFNNRILINGRNNSNSIADFYAALANGSSITDIEEDVYGDYSYDVAPAWWTFLINNIENTNQYYGTTPPGGIIQEKFIETWGSMNELTFAFGGNYDDKLYIGASLNIPYFNYKERNTLTEYAIQTTIPEETYRSAVVYENLNASGTGVNLKLGAIYRPIEWFRFGLALHTPTFYTQIQDNWDMTIKSFWDTYDDESSSSPLGSYEYSLNTPFRTVTSFAFIFKNYGLVSVDYELIDYASASLDSPHYAFQTENEEISNTYKTTSNIRLGTEWRYQNLSFRGGFSLYGSPYKNDINEGSIKSYSLGFGFKERKFYFDIAWVLTEISEDYYMYGYGNVNANKATIDSKHSNFMITYGLNF